MRKAAPINLKEEQKAELSAWAKRGGTPQKHAQRCRIVLLAAEGNGNEWIGNKLGMSRQKVARWRGRYLESGLPGLLRDRAGRGRPAKIKPEDKAELIRRTLEETPPMATQWSTRRMAAVSGLAASSVGLIWRNHGVKPHLVRGFKLSKDKRFVEKLEEIVGLYLNAPEHALVLCCDEKSQIQALDRRQPGLPLRQGKVENRLHGLMRGRAAFAGDRFAALSTLQPTYQRTEGSN